MNFDVIFFSSNPRKRQKRDSGSINEPEVAIKDFAKNLKDETDVTSQVVESANMHHHIEPKSEVSNDGDDNGEDHDENSMGSKMESKTPPNLNPSSFLGMAAAGLMDPSAAKGTFCNVWFLN